MIIGIDFDGTIVTHEYPKIGKPIKGAIETMKELIANGHQIILWTMRSGVELVAAVEYLNSHGIKLFGINENPDQHKWTKSPKAYCQYYIDDAAIGCPLERLTDGSRPMVYWPRIRQFLQVNGLISKT